MLHLPPSPLDHTLYGEPLYKSILARLTASDQDQEVKECAIMCMGQLVAFLGSDSLKGQLGTCLPLLLDRLRNDVTRLAAVKAFATIAQVRAFRV